MISSYCWVCLLLGVLCFIEASGEVPGLDMSIHSIKSDLDGAPLTDQVGKCTSTSLQPGGHMHELLTPGKHLHKQQQMRQCSRATTQTPGAQSGSRHSFAVVCRANVPNQRDI